MVESEGGGGIATVAAGILPAVEGGILPPGQNRETFKDLGD